MNPIIIRAELSNPPSIPLSFRWVVLYSRCMFKLNVCVELDRTDKCLTDIYYKWMKDKGLIQFVDDIIYYGDAKALVRLDPKIRKYEDTIVIDRIVPENSCYILDKIKSYNR